jgi:hypothetical protein
MNSVTLPINYATLGYGPTGAIPSRGQVDYCPGPSAVNVGWSLREPYTDRWVFWQPTGGGLRGAIWTEGFEISDTAGQEFSLFFPGEVVDHFTVCFDATGYPIVATDDGAGTVRLLAVNNEVIVEKNFAGKTPRLFSLAGLLWQDADLYVVCYYIGADGTIKARYQRNEFNDEATIGNPSIQLKALTKVDAIDRRICLWATESAASRAATRQVVYRTNQYNPLPLIQTDAGALQVEPQGAVEDLVQPGGTFAEAATVSTDVQGAVASTILLVTITPEVATLDVEPQGAVAETIELGGTFADSATLSTDPQGVTVETIEDVPPITETATLATSPQGAIQNV